MKAIGAVFVPGESAAAEASSISGYAQNPNPAAGTVADGRSFYLSTVGGRWVAQTGSASGSQVIAIQAPYVVDGAISATKTATAAFDLKWVNGAWRIAALEKGDPTKVAAGGTSFTSGC